MPSRTAAQPTLHSLPQRRHPDTDVSQVAAHVAGVLSVTCRVTVQVFGMDNSMQFLMTELWSLQVVSTAAGEFGASPQ